MKYRVVNRYSDTNNPDKHGRWARIVYAGNMRIAWIKKGFISDKLYIVTDYFPSQHNDAPCFSDVLDDDLETVVDKVKERFEYFLKQIVV